MSQSAQHQLHNLLLLYMNQNTEGAVSLVQAQRQFSIYDTSNRLAMNWHSSCNFSSSLQWICVVRGLDSQYA